MRIDDWTDILALIASVHDGFWPAKSPTPAPKMAQCKSPDPRCKSLDYAFPVGKHTFCRAPAEWTVQCERWQENKAPAHTPQRCEPAHFPMPRVNPCETRQQRRLARLQAWVCRELDALRHDTELAYTARVLRTDTDSPLSTERVEQVCQHILDRYMRLPRGQR